MTRGRVQSPAAVAVFGEDGPARGASGPVIDDFQPVRSRWVWQPRLPELWLHEQERLHFRETVHGRKKRV
jgi:hypothetical protein